MLLMDPSRKEMYGKGWRHKHVLSFCESDTKKDQESKNGISLQSDIHTIHITINWIRSPINTERDAIQTQVGSSDTDPIGSYKSDRFLSKFAGILDARLLSDFTRRRKVSKWYGSGRIPINSHKFRRPRKSYRNPASRIRYFPIKAFRIRENQQWFWRGFYRIRHSDCSTWEWNLRRESRYFVIRWILSRGLICVGFFSLHHTFLSSRNRTF